MTRGLYSGAVIHGSDNSWGAFTLELFGSVLLLRIIVWTEQLDQDLLEKTGTKWTGAFFPPFFVA